MIVPKWSRVKLAPTVENLSECRNDKEQKGQRKAKKRKEAPYCPTSHMIATWQESEVVPSRNPQLGHQGHHGAIGAIDAIQGIQGIQGMQHRGRATCATCATWL